MDGFVKVLMKRNVTWQTRAIWYYIRTDISEKVENDCEFSLSSRIFTLQILLPNVQFCNSSFPQFVLSIISNRPVRDQWEFSRKMERHCLINWTGPTKRNGSCHFLFLFRIPQLRQITGLSKKRDDEFRSEYSNEIGDHVPEVVPIIPVGSNWNGLFHLNSNRDSWNLWDNGKHPEFEVSEFLAKSHCSLNEISREQLAKMYVQAVLLYLPTQIRFPIGGECLPWVKTH